MITVRSSGSFRRTETFLNRLLNRDPRSILEKYGRAGVNALASATPKDSGLAATSWFFTVEGGGDYYKIVFRNSDIENGHPVAIMIQYGHGTGTGGYVQGRDYINPAIQPIFDQIADELWKEVTSA